MVTRFINLVVNINIPEEELKNIQLNKEENNNYNFHQPIYKKNFL